jgi:hypothetical protein
MHSTWPFGMDSFATDSIVIVYTKARNYKHWRYSYKNAQCQESRNRIFSWPLSFDFVQGVWYSNCTFPTSWTGVLGAVYCK